MPGPLQIDGKWPESVTIRRGWGKAIARPWNDLTGHGSIRLVRGNSVFLGDAAEWVADKVNGTVLSPALYPSGVRIWERAGFTTLLQLNIMEKILEDRDEPSDRVKVVQHPNIEELGHVDQRAFDRFWHMGEAGLVEAINAAPESRVIEARHNGDLVGYAIVGVQLGIAFLQRIAVEPNHRSTGLGSELLGAASNWSLDVGAASMILNVELENETARNVYLRAGFVDTKKHLRVVRYER